MAVLGTATSERGTPKQRFRWPRVPPNYFGIAFGVAGLAQA